MVTYALKNGKSIYLDGFIMRQLDSVVYNIDKDWDFVIIITGDRMVRTGKSVLGMTVCAYLADRLNVPYTIDNVYFDGDKMIKDAINKPKFSIHHLDEAGKEFRRSGKMRHFQDNLVDYLEQCGQLNQIFVLVLPDFFKLREDIAVARSEHLINVYRRTEKITKKMYGEDTARPVDKFTRGYFQFFDRKRKTILYDKATTTKRKNYFLTKANFIGRFTNNYPIDQEAYREKKMTYLKELEQTQADERTPTHKADIIRDTMIIKMHKDKKKTKEIREYLNKEYNYDISVTHINKIKRDYLENQRIGLVI